MDRLSMAFEVKSVDKKQRIIAGYASTSHLDKGSDIVHKDAAKFDDPRQVLPFIGHDYKSLPLGIPIKIQQDENGLYTETKIHKTHAGDDLLTVAEERGAAGLPLGISIGYPTGTLKTKYENKDGAVVRHILSYELKEYSFTPIPMNDHAVVTAVKDMSDEERRSEIQTAIRAKRATPAAEAPSSYLYVTATYDDYVIVADDNGNYFKVPYTINADDEAELGDQVEVEQAWVEKKDALRVASATKAGRVLSDKNLRPLQQIHDAAHSMADAAGHDLHAQGDEDDGESKEEGPSAAMRMQTLDIELAELAI